MHVCVFVVLLTLSDTVYNNNILVALLLCQSVWINQNEKKRSEETQTLRAGCSKAEPKKFAPPQTPSRGADGQKLISWRWSLYLYLKTQFLLLGSSYMQFRVIVATDSQTVA